MRNVLVAVMAALLLWVGVGYLFSAANVATAPGRVLDRAVATDNIVGSYEEFFDMRAAYAGRLAEVRALKAQLTTAASNERMYAQTDLNGSRQSCRQVALRYNAQSQKINHGAFKSAGLPSELDAAACEE